VDRVNAAVNHSESVDTVEARRRIVANEQWDVRAAELEDLLLQTGRAHASESTCPNAL
jgi:hypothetical protein